ncbi:sigma-70 family RNA polymerase sigma factor [Gammaproteobacteria bacterium]|nr:sigma-70 family RNA polymerase sigma factor [Gammaproteobacteria bacterium]
MRKKKESNKDIDIALVRRARAGDYRAFDLLVVKYQSRLISLAFKFSKDLQVAEDIVQDSLIKSFKSLDSFREDSSFYTWVYRITVNTSKNFLVSKKRKDELLASDMHEDGSLDLNSIETDNPESLLKASELKDILTSTLNQLGEDTKTALTLREFDGLSYEQISEIVNCPVGTVRSRIFRGREILEKAIKKYKTEDRSLLTGAKS